MTRAILLAHARSGSTVLGEVVSSMQDIGVFGEVCNTWPNPPDKSGASFQRFRFDWTRQHDGYLCGRGVAVETELLDAYFDHLSELAGTGSVMFQVKYAHLHHFEQQWYEPLSVPCLFLSCRKLGIRLLHLHRKDTLAAACSNELALKRGIWHCADEATVRALAPVEVDVARVVRNAELYQRQISLVEKEWLADIPHFPITYEDVARGLGGDRKVFQSLASFLDLQWCGELNVRNEKLGQPLNEAVTNYAELQRALAHMKAPSTP